MTKLAALLAGLLAGGAMLADAAEVAARTDTQVTDTQVVVLANTQMDKITAGHLYEPPTGAEPGMKGNPRTPHEGWYWIKLGSAFGHDLLMKTRGWHTMCGAAKPNC